MNSPTDMEMVRNGGLSMELDRSRCLVPGVPGKPLPFSPCAISSVSYAMGNSRSARLDHPKFCRALLQDPDSEPETESERKGMLRSTETTFNEQVSEQSTVFHRLYDAAERRKANLERMRTSHKRTENEVARRMSNVGRMINSRSRAMAEISRGNQDVFSRLYDEGKKINAKKQQVSEQAILKRQENELCERPSQYKTSCMLEPFQPDIGPAARQLHRKNNLLASLDADGRRKHREIQLREAVKRAQAMEGCTFQPHITAKSQQIAIARNRRDECMSVHRELHEMAPKRKDMPSAGSKISDRGNNTDDSMLSLNGENSDEGGWQVFEKQVLNGGSISAGVRSMQSPPKARTNDGYSTEGGSDDQKALERIKESRIQAIFKLLDSDGDGLVKLPVIGQEMAEMVSILRDAEVATLLVDALAFHASKQESSKFGQEIKYYDFKTACFSYFSNTRAHASRHSLPWKTILAYEKASIHALPEAATRAVKSFQTQGSTRRDFHAFSQSPRTVRCKNL